MEVALGMSQLDIDIFCKWASKLTLSQLVDNVMVRECLTVQSDACWTEFVIVIVFFLTEPYTEEYDILPQKVLAVFVVVFPLILKEIRTEGKGSKESVAGEAEAEDGEGEGESPSHGNDDNG